MPGLEGSKGLPRNSITIIPAGPGLPYSLPCPSCQTWATWAKRLWFNALASQRPPSPDCVQTVNDICQWHKEGRCKNVSLESNNSYYKGWPTWPQRRENQERKLFSGITFTPGKYYSQTKTFISAQSSLMLVPDPSSPKPGEILTYW